MEAKRAALYGDTQRMKFIELRLHDKYEFPLCQCVTPPKKREIYGGQLSKLTAATLAFSVSLEKH